MNPLPLNPPPPTTTTFTLQRLDDSGHWSYKAGDTMARGSFRDGTPVTDVEEPRARGVYTECELLPQYGVCLWLGGVQHVCGGFGVWRSPAYEVCAPNVHANMWRGGGVPRGAWQEVCAFDCARVALCCVGVVCSDGMARRCLFLGPTSNPHPPHTSTARLFVGCGYFHVDPATHKLEGNAYWHSSLPARLMMWRMAGLNPQVEPLPLISVSWMANNA